MKSAIVILNLLISGFALFSQNVGIGVVDPMYRLDVLGSIHTTSNAFVEGSLGLSPTRWSIIGISILTWCLTYNGLPL